MSKFDSSIVLCKCGHTAEQHTNLGCSSFVEGEYVVPGYGFVKHLCDCGMNSFDVINEFVNEIFNKFGITIGEPNESN